MECNVFHSEASKLVSQITFSYSCVSANVTAAAVPVPVPAATTANTASTAAETTPAAVAPPPTVPKRDPNTRLKGPRLSIATRSNTIAGPVAHKGGVDAKGKNNTVLTELSEDSLLQK